MREEMHMVKSRPLVFVHGKGGVGKTCISQALALDFARKGKRTLWVEFENPSRPVGDSHRVAGDLRGNLWHLNADAMLAFDEYAALKIGKLGGLLGAFGGATGLTKIFLQNKLIQYLAQAAPGIHELVLLGKVWFERNHYDHVVVDMPSTGYSLAMFQSTLNFAKLFRGGPLNRDAEAIIATMGNADETSHLIVAIPEEMPLLEALELDRVLKDFFPRNPASFALNKRFPKLRPIEESEKEAPFAATVLEYAERRSSLEAKNLKLWTDAGVEFAEIPLFAPDEPVPERIAAQLL
jgi:anion-transporting  ArsA/GET3 family ATPase